MHTSNLQSGSRRHSSEHLSLRASGSGDSRKEPVLQLFVMPVGLPRKRLRVVCLIEGKEVLSLHVGDILGEVALWSPNSIRAATIQGRQAGVVAMLLITELAAFVSMTMADASLAEATMWLKPTVLLVASQSVFASERLLASSWPIVIREDAPFQYDARAFEVQRDTKATL